MHLRSWPPTSGARPSRSGRSRSPSARSPPADLGDDVVEIGPGPGLTTDLLRTRVPALTAVELDPDLAAALAGRMAGSNVEVVEADATAMPFEDGRFSGAVTFTMLHHVPTVELQDRLFADVRRVLRPGGLFVANDSVASERAGRLPRRRRLQPGRPGDPGGPTGRRRLHRRRGPQQRVRLGLPRPPPVSLTRVLAAVRGLLRDAPRGLGSGPGQEVAADGLVVAPASRRAADRWAA